MTQEAELTVADAAPFDYSGWSVAISGDTAVVGSFLDDDLGNASGSASVFVRSGGGWVQQAKLTASDGGAGDVLGYSVAISGDIVVVGANGHGVSGAAYVFVRSAGLWSEQAKLTSASAGPGDAFGAQVAISGDTIVVGADLDGHAGDWSGSAYVFVRSGSSWSEQAKLTADDAAAFDFFGASLAVHGQTAVIGSRGDDDLGNFAGAAYVFVRDGAAWSQEAKLTADDGAAFDRFGRSVAVEGDRVLVGMPGDDDAGPLSGSAYLFERTGSSWTQAAKLVAGAGAAFDFFGWSVAISGDRAVVSAPDDDEAEPESGAVYVFDRCGAAWPERARLTAADGALADELGIAVAVSADLVVAGVPFDDDAGTDAGSAYVFEVALDPATLFLDLAVEVEALDLPEGTENSLLANLGNAYDKLTDGNENNDVAAIGSLEAFINAVEAQRGEKIPEAAADALIAAAQKVIDRISCG